jgi:hypothetical protein
VASDAARFVDHGPEIVRQTVVGRRIHHTNGQFVGVAPNLKFQT